MRGALWGRAGDDGRTIALSIGLTVGLGAGVTSATPASSEPVSRWVATIPTDSVKQPRATVRDAPGRLVLANAFRGDDVAVTGYCGAWVHVRVAAAHAMSTPEGWVKRTSLARTGQSGGLRGVARRCDLAAQDERRWPSYVSAMNAPFRSYYRNEEVNPRRPWRRVYFAVRVRLVTSPECTPSYNYVLGTPDRVDPAQRVSGLDLSRAGYRYVTKSGAVAMVSVTRPGQTAGVWAFVPSGCVRGRDGGPPYMPHVVQFDRLPQRSDGSMIRTLPDTDLRRFNCHAAVPSPTSPAFGWWPDPVPGKRPACPY